MFSLTPLTLTLLVLPCLACLPGMAHVGRRDTIANKTAAVQVRIVPRPRQTKTALVNVRVFDGYMLQSPSTIVFDGDTITEDSNNVDHVIDGQNGILLPGLIDSHCHPDLIEDLEDLSSYGVTTAMSMNCNNYEQCAVLRNQIGLTAFFSAGLSAVGPNSDHAQADHRPLDKTISTPEAAPEWVEAVFNNGSDYLKITSEENGPDQATQNALVLYTHARGRKTMTHAADYEHYVMAVISNTNGPQHMPFDKLLNDSILDLMVSQQQFATPTMNLYKVFLHNVNAFISNAPPIDYTEAYGTVQENVRRIRQRGIPILAAADSSVGDRPASMPFGVSLHEELANFVEIGFSPEEAIRAATIIPALAHNLEGRGQIAPGKRADLLLLQPDADPFIDINDTRKIARVWNGGVEYKAIS